LSVEGCGERDRRRIRQWLATVHRRADRRRGADRRDPARERSRDHSGSPAREAQIALLARDGLSNPEIGTRLVISARTVQYHVRKVFTKLGISSRSQLGTVLPRGPASGRRHR
jgi:DNA-binding NarL/FixJ family response regulator